MSRESRSAFISFGIVLLTAAVLAVAGNWSLFKGFLGL